jgi:hypothetical protein
MASDALAGGAVALGFVAVATGAFSILGFDDRGFTYLVMSGAPLRRVLWGKALASLTFLIPVMGVFVVVEALINDSWAEALLAFVAGVATLVAGVGVGGVVSVAAPANRVRPGKRGSGQLVWALLGAVMLLVPIGGVAFVGLLIEDWPWVVALLAVVVAGAVCWGSLRWAGARLANEPERVLAALGGG